MIAYVFQQYPENFAFQLFIILPYNLPLKFTIFLKIAYFLTVSIVFSFFNQNFKTR